MIEADFNQLINQTKMTTPITTNDEEVQKLLADMFKCKPKRNKQRKLQPEPEPKSMLFDIEQQRLEAASWKGYDYNFMLNRLEDELQKRGINQSMRGEKFSLSTATLAITLKGKKTTIDNFDAWVLSVSKTKNATFDLRREHAANYILSECCCEGVLNCGKLILRGRFRTNRIELILKKYIVAYHRCKCDSTKTQLHRCSTIRKFYNECENCGSKIYLEDYKIVNLVLVASKEK